MRKTILILGITAIAVALTFAVLADDVEKAKIKVEGMKCERCASKVTEALKKVDGVVSVKACHVGGMAYVEFDKAKTNLASLENTIAATGYNAGEAKAENPHVCTEEKEHQCHEGAKAEEGVHHECAEAQEHHCSEGANKEEQDQQHKCMHEKGHEESCCKQAEGEKKCCDHQKKCEKKQSEKQGDEKKEGTKNKSEQEQ